MPDQPRPLPGQPTALKQLIKSRLETLGHPALTQLRWVISRFGGADGPGWSAPADGELSEHFTDRFLEVTTLSGIAARLREELVVTQDDSPPARARAGGIGLEAEAEAEPPHRRRAGRGRLGPGPLGMTSSTFPASWPHDDPDAVTGYGT
jgi:hypothetical protein